MVEENKEETEGKTPEESEINHTAENLESLGQQIIGGIEQIGGVLTGDPVTRAEGNYNVDAGLLHQDSNKVLTAIEKDEEAEAENAGAKNAEPTKSAE